MLTTIEFNPNKWKTIILFATTITDQQMYPAIKCVIGVMIVIAKSQ